MDKPKFLGLIQIRVLMKGYYIYVPLSPIHYLLTARSHRSYINIFDDNYRFD